MRPTIGRIVLFKLSERDAAEINRRRTTTDSIHGRMIPSINEETPAWPEGAQAHIGNHVTRGDIYPMIVVRVWDGNLVNGQVLLDGCDTYWATSVLQGDSEHEWAWPTRETV